MGRPKKNAVKEDKPKSKSLFDHVNQIRNVKNPNYFQKLSEQDKKSFNHYMICRFLSMDPNSINESSYLTKIFDKMDSESFYKVACAVIKSVKFTPYIKSKNKKFNKELLEFVSRKYEVSKSDSNEYCEILSSTDTGIQELHNICSGYGLSEKEIGKIISKDED